MKKIILMLGVCLMLCTLTSCNQSDMKKTDYNGTSYEELNQMCSSLFQALGSLSDEEITSYEQGSDDLQKNMVQSYEDSIKEAGAFKGTEEDCTITRTGKTLTVEKKATCEKRNIKLVVVYNYNDMSQPTAVTVECVYTVGEKMAKAGKNTAICLVIVFSILILISLIISCFKVIPYLQQKFSKKRNRLNEKTASQVIPLKKSVTVENVNDETELIAVIAAAISAATDTPVDGFVVRSIKRRK